MKMLVQQRPPALKWNSEEIKEYVNSFLCRYEDIEYTEDTMSAAKKDRADLNAAKKAIDKRRIEVKKAYMEPFDNFELEVREIEGLFDKSIQKIDLQVKEFENKKKAEKNELLTAFFRTTAGEDFPVSFDRIFNPKWLNATVSEKKAKEEISSAVLKIRDDMAELSALEPEDRETAEKAYLRNFSLEEAKQEAEKSRIAKQKQAQPAQQPAATGVSEKRYQAKFLIHGTERQFKELFAFMKEQGIACERI